jgi:alkyl hydroperoxide reductase subunit AhpC
VIPAAQGWYAKYKDQGFEIIGVHTPEFNHERDLNNVQDAMQRLGVTWPVAIDNDWATWQAYHNRYWPAAYFIDKKGDIRFIKIGEGHYDYAEAVIQALLAEPPG